MILTAAEIQILLNSMSEYPDTEAERVLRDKLEAMLRLAEILEGR